MKYVDHLLNIEFNAVNFTSNLYTTTKSGKGSRTTNSKFLHFLEEVYYIFYLMIFIYNAYFKKLQVEKRILHSNGYFHAINSI